MKPFLKITAISCGAAIGIIILGTALNIGYAIGAWKLNLEDGE